MQISPAALPNHAFTQVAEGLFCIDTDLYRPGLAACYLLEDQGQLALIDTGTACAVPRILAVIAHLGFSPEAVDWIIPTHVHLDHAGATGDLLAVCPQAQVLIHPKGAPHLIDPTKLIAGATAVYGEDEFLAHFGGLTAVPAERVIEATDEQVIRVGTRSLCFLDTPGHANHHGCLFDEHTQGCFTGDTFGIAYREFHTAQGPWLYAPTTPVAFDPERWLASIERILALKPQALYLTHFGKVEQPEQCALQLRASIQAMADVALTLEDQPPGSARIEQLRTAVAEVLLNSARAWGVTLPEATLRELLAVDLALNSQGLEVWLQRRARQAQA